MQHTHKNHTCSLCKRFQEGPAPIGCGQLTCDTCVNARTYYTPQTTTEGQAISRHSSTLRALATPKMAANETQLAFTFPVQR
jgi:hypothetical protein